MKSHRIVLSSVAVALATIMAASPAAHAQERNLLVLIDASGTMNSPDPDGKATTLFEEAKIFSIGRIVFHAGENDPQSRPLKVAVFTFQGDDTEPAPHTDGFVSPSEALMAIICLSMNPGKGCQTKTPFSLTGHTPLAHALCSSLTFLLGHSSKDDVKLMQVSASGQEDSSRSPPCAGVEGSFDPKSQIWTPADSWQARVIQNFKGKGISAHIDFLDLAPNTPPLVIPQ